MSKMTVQNESGQVVTFDVTGPEDARARVLEQRIARGELKRVAGDTPSTPLGATTIVVVEDEHTGMRDEAGNLLKSVHGGGRDPDFAGDALGQPSGSVPAADLGDHVVGVTAYREGRYTPEEVAAIQMANLEREGASDIPDVEATSTKDVTVEDTSTAGDTDGDSNAADGEQPAEEQAETPPSRSASKADWFEYATGPGKLSEAEAEGMTRDQLAERFLGAKTA